MVSIGVEMDEIIDFEEGIVYFNGKKIKAVSCRDSKGFSSPYLMITVGEYLKVLSWVRPDIKVLKVSDVLNSANGKN